MTFPDAKGKLVDAETGKPIIDANVKKFGTLGYGSQAGGHTEMVRTY